MAAIDRDHLDLMREVEHKDLIAFERLGECRLRGHEVARRHIEIPERGVSDTLCTCRSEKV